MRARETRGMRKRIKWIKYSWKVVRSGGIGVCVCVSSFFPFSMGKHRSWRSKRKQRKILCMWKKGISILMSFALENLQKCYKFVWINGGDKFYLHIYTNPYSSIQWILLAKLKCFFFVNQWMVYHNRSTGKQEECRQNKNSKRKFSHSLWVLEMDLENRRRINYRVRIH